MVQSQGPPQVGLALGCLYMACASVRESQAVFASIPACGEIVTCVGRVTTGWGHPPQSHVVPDLQFSSPGSQGRAGKPPQAPPTARPHMAFYSCSFWGPPLPVALETLGLLYELWEAGRLCCCPTRRISKEGEVRSREERPALMEVEQKSESGLTCLLL